MDDCWPMSDDESSLPPVKSIARAADILRVLAKEANGFALTDIARQAGPDMGDSCIPGAHVFAGRLRRLVLAMHGPDFVFLIL